MSWKNKPKVKPVQNSKYPRDPEEERNFDDLRRKYSYAVVYLLVKNIAQSELRSYLELDENKVRYEGLKKFRADIIEMRPRAKQWVDKAFYIGLKVGEVDVTSEGITQTQLIAKDCIFKQKTQVISCVQELDGYLDTLAKIFDSEKIWNDPMMEAFDFGERTDNCDAVKKKRTKKKSSTGEFEEDRAELNISEDEDMTVVADSPSIIVTRSRASV